MKRFLLFTIAIFVLGIGFNAQAQFSYGESSGDTSLPVALSSFTAQPLDGKVTLFWRTETEINNAGFSIYRSETTDGNASSGKYTEISFIEGAGNAGMTTDYKFIDVNVEPGKTYFYYLEDIDVFGDTNRSRVVKVVVPARAIPKKFRLLQSYPNPFNPETWIPYQLAYDAEVTIRIYNVFGNLVNTLSLGMKEANYYITKNDAAYWDGKNSAGESVGSGIYLYTIQAGEFFATRRMVVIK
jgi:hypothetical protein